MRGKRFAALALTLAMALSLLTVSASAVTFSDITRHWAKSDIETLATDGVVNGVGDNKFAPDRKMTACEALLFCSRTTGVSSGDKAKIAEAWAEELKTLLPEDMYSWACKEMAVCLETGIISATELAALNESGALKKTITRENLTMYLVRAMQLDALAKNLTTYPLTFADADAVSAAMQPYVYLLNMYGVVKGNESNQFMPQGTLSRAEMTTMLRRTIDFMDERGIYAELPAYTSYDWTGGTIAAVTTSSSGIILLTLDNAMSGALSVSLPADVEIYESNMLADSDALKVGKYARVNLNSKGAAESVRLGGTLQSYTGSVTDIREDALAISVNGTSKRWEIDRFTQVQVGKTVGDASLIDVEAGYTTAVCQVDELGHLAAVQLTGGTRAEEGILVSVTSASGGQTIQVASFNGVTTRYTVPAGAGITVNGLVGTLQTSHAGDYVSLRVSNDDSSKVYSMNVDTVTQYVQGSVRSYTTAKATNTLVLEDLTSGRSTTYNLLSSAVIRFNGETIALSKLEKNTFATLRLSSGEIALVDAYPGSTTAQGTIESITYASPTLLYVRQADNSVLSYELPLDNLPTIYRDGKTSSVDKLKSGDTVEVTVRYNQVSQIEATSQSANVTGTITKVVQDSSTGVTLELMLITGESVTYTVSEGVSVTQEGTVSNVWALRVNDKVGLVVSGGEVISIEVSKSSASGTVLTGTVFTKNTTERTLMILLSDGNVVTVDVSSASFVDAAGGSLSLSRLSGDDAVTVYGSYSGAKFKATLVVRT
ncbi:S-layer homology domain-containing protein [Lawsonibacter celer]|uniref:S-layer homology domain-containing protein n=1 Tax=Lawsonibacter celer TaxID=2986526 RepID=UPI001646ACC1|nr:S-layer homology domain-containing protein [Lawsonibacter celer]